jgi:gas vesicle protein
MFGIIDGFANKRKIAGMGLLAGAVLGSMAALLNASESIRLRMK